MVAEPLEGPTEETASSPEEPAADLLQRFFNVSGSACQCKHFVLVVCSHSIQFNVQNNPTIFYKDYVIAQERHEIIHSAFPRGFSYEVSLNGSSTCDCSFVAFVFLGLLDGGCWHAISLLEKLAMHGRKRLSMKLSHYACRALSS